ncbi:MAG: exodeoxyribonuclease VII small subunit [Nitrospirae bacterium]|nr:exodeoxyribonuclease VII small subunit [Nitrospirota bacterium]
MKEIKEVREIKETRESKEKLSYSAALKDIESIINEIERETIDVDVLTVKVKTAIELIKGCKSKLRKTEEELSGILKEFEELEQPEKEPERPQAIEKPQTTERLQTTEGLPATGQPQAGERSRFTEKPQAAEKPRVKKTLLDDDPF